MTAPRAPNAGYEPQPADPALQAAPGLTLPGMFRQLLAHWKLLSAVPLAAGVITYGITMLVPQTFTARASLIPPQQQAGGGAAAALAQLGSLASLAGGGLKTPADQYVSLLQSASVSNRIVEQFDLMAVYDVKFRQDARKELADNVRIAAGKKDGLLAIEVDDRDPKRAADMANAYVEQLRHLTNTLAVTEAQQRRVFFESQLKQARDNLAKSQVALQASGFNPGALKAEPKAAAEVYARLRAEVTSAEIRVQALQRVLTDQSPELMQQQAALGRLRAELARAEQRSDPQGEADYISRYREYKYQETLFDLFARQYELARVDESREGGLIQVVDVATPPERRSKPRRGLITIGVAMLVFIGLATWVLVRPPAAGARRPRDAGGRRA